MNIFCGPKVKIYLKNEVKMNVMNGIICRYRLPVFSIIKPRTQQLDYVRRQGLFLVTDSLNFMCFTHQQDYIFIIIIAVHRRGKGGES